MYKSVILSVVLIIISFPLSGQENQSADVNQPADSNPSFNRTRYVMKVTDANYADTTIDNSPPQRIIEDLDTPYTNHTDTFVEAFSDPNIVIGVFDINASPDFFGKLSDKELENAIHALIESIIRFDLFPLHLVKPIKGEFKESIIFIRPIRAPQFERRPKIPNFVPVGGSKWVLALRKTSQSYREEIYGKEIEKYEYLNESTLFRPFRYGYGALCLKWPEQSELPISSRTLMPLKEPEGLLKVPESIVEDLEAIQKAMPLIQKENKDPNDTAALAKTSQTLKNDIATAIFNKVFVDQDKKEETPTDRRNRN